MKFSVPTNWQKDLISSICRKEVSEVYGKLQADFVGGAKLSSQLPFVTKRQVKTHVQEAHKAGLKFNYLLNASCLDNLEFTTLGQRKIRYLLDWLMEIEVDTVTIGTPYLLEFVKKQYPQFKISVSDVSGINSLKKAQFWESLGADSLTLINTDVNRNFLLIKEIRKNITSELRLVANANCLYKCPFYYYHANLASHASQSFHPSRGFVIDYCRLICRYQQIVNPVNFIRSTWIRPEDVHYYEDVGIDSLKLIDRGMSTKTILSIADAYVNRRYDGNLLDLFPDFTKNIMFNKSNLRHKIKYFFHPLLVNIFKMFEMRKLLTKGAFWINNRDLDGFLQHFVKDNCNAGICQDCGYCENIARKVIKADLNIQSELTETYNKILGDLISGKTFRYL